MERQRRSNVPAAAVAPAAVQAQEAQEIGPASTSSPVADVPVGPSWPSAEAIAGAVLGGLGDVIQRALVGFFEQSGAAIFGRLLTAAFGVVADWLWRAAGPLFGGVNVFTQLPPPWSYDLRPVGELRGRLEPVARAVVLLGLVLGIGWAVAGTLLGRPFGRLLNVVPTFLLATGGLLVAPQLCRWWIDFCNALSGALLDPRTGLPGLAQVQGWEQFSALGVVAVVYLVVCLLLLLHRLSWWSSAPCCSPWRPSLWRRAPCPCPRPSDSSRGGCRRSSASPSSRCCRPAAWAWAPPCSRPRSRGGGRTAPPRGCSRPWWASVPSRRR
jgi:hypothetical protein